MYGIKQSDILKAISVLRRFGNPVAEHLEEQMYKMDWGNEVSDYEVNEDYDELGESDDDLSCL